MEDKIVKATVDTSIQVGDGYKHYAEIVYTHLNHKETIDDLISRIQKTYRGVVSATVENIEFISGKVI